MVILPNYNESSNRFTFTSLTSKKKFKYGKFEIRAALPFDKMLKTAIALEPTERQNSDSHVWSKDGKISLISNSDSNIFYYGIHFAFDGKVKYVGKNVDNSNRVYDFHVYAIEWTDAEIRWIIDGVTLFKASFGKELGNYYNPFNKDFKITFSLDSGFSELSTEVMSNEQDNCPILILDYIRVYQKQNFNKTTSTFQDNNMRKPEICGQFKQFFHTSPNTGMSSSFILLIGLLSIVLAMIAFNVVLIIRMKMKKKIASEEKDRRNKDSDYADIIYQGEKYKDDFENNDNVYDEIIIENDPDRVYLEITNDYKEEPYTAMDK